MAIFFIFGQTGYTAYSHIRKTSDGTVWNGSSWESWNAANWATYSITITEQTSSGYYQGTFPAGITDDDAYFIATYGQVGGSPAVGDSPIAQDLYKFDGTNLYNQVSLTAQMKSDVLSQVQLAFNTAVPVSPTADSIYERIKAIDDRLPSGNISGFDPTTDGVNLNASQTGVTIGQVNALGTAALASIASEISDALRSDTIAELSGVPSSTPNIAAALMFIYMALRNKRTASTSQEKVYNAAGSTIATASVSDSGSEYTKEVFS